MKYNNMKDNNILLSICIPTCNGGKPLIENLNVLLPQLVQSNISTEVIISDNGSSDDNYRMIDEYCQSVNYKIELYHHKENIGGRANFAFVADKARGYYIFMLGDDDVLSPNFIDIVSPLLSQKKYTIVHFNFIVADEQLNCRGIVAKQYETSFLECTTGDLIKDNRFDLTFMSSLIITKESWVIGENYVKDEYYGYEWFARMCFGAIKSDNKSLFYYFPLVVQRNPQKPWANMRPIFNYIGQRMIYKDLEPLIPGIYEAKTKRRKLLDVEHDFSLMLVNQNFYREYVESFKKTLNGREYAILHTFLYTRIPKARKFLHTIKYRFNQLRRLL